MSTIGKALTLLDVLSRLNTEAGLTEIAQACGYDKATTRRFLVDLEKHGFVEQLAESRKYRIGAEPLRLARIREARYPFLGTALPFVRQLAERTGETVHLSEFSNGRLSTIHVEESPRAHRVFINVGMILPFHATASGLAYLAACADDVVEATVTKSLDTFTEFTIADPEEVRRRVREARQNGFSVNRQGLEVGVMSTSAAILTPGSRPVGCITVREDLSVVLADLAPQLDQGLIHADLVRENVFLRDGSVAFIDFDDCGFGFRLFDLATVLLRNRREPDYPALRAALLSGYEAVRPRLAREFAHLPLFLLLRALTYIGWAAARPELPDNIARLNRYVADVRALVEEEGISR
ncbi:phosphotransferase [Brucella sp. BO2]|nr:phosphotransferase [Brucella sp. BO2]